MEQLPGAGWRLACRAAFKVNLPGYKQQKVYADIISVVLGVKPALLIDCAQTTAEEFQVLLTDVCHHTSHESEIRSTEGTQPDLGSHHCTCIFENCCIITLNDDVLLVNLTAQTSMGVSHSDKTDGIGYWPCYMNIERGQTCPHTIMQSDSKYSYIESVYTKLCDELESAIKGSNTRLTSDSEGERYVLPSQWEEAADKENNCTYLIPCRCGSKQGVTTAREIDLLNQSQNINLCTLFGRLLGYPLVYWFDPEIGYSLDMVDLVCYTVTVRKRQDSHSHNHFFDIFQQVCVY